MPRDFFSLIPPPVHPIATPTMHDVKYIFFLLIPIESFVRARHDRELQAAHACACAPN
jgi:hypothetical protein